jgi:BirA family biotin operon repressor/biotin-[acetyl-CoA-carboxylase] ligase
VNYSLDAAGPQKVACCGAIPALADNRPDFWRNAMNERDLLQALTEGPSSGDALARRFGLTRAAVWKRIEALRAGGVPIHAEAGRGYWLEHPVELLEAGAIRQAMTPAAAGALSDLEVAWSLDSTNAEALRRGAPSQGTRALFAERQTAGRGRRGRSWIGSPGNSLLLSLSRRFDGGLARLGGLSLVAGVAVAEALQAIGLQEVALKWPNDVVVAQRKLGGLLVEGSGEAAGSASAVVGLGLNLRMPASAGAALDQPWTDLASHLASLPARNVIAARLLDHLLPALDQFDAAGLPPFLARYARLDALQGAQIVLHGHAGQVDGIALGVASDGALRVAVAGTERQVHSGEVSVRLA